MFLHASLIFAAALLAGSSACAGAEPRSRFTPDVRSSAFAGDPRTGCGPANPVWPGRSGAPGWNRTRPPGLIRVSKKSREIARRLDRSGYYSRYSRALKGYPHLRSKKSSRRRGAEAGYDAGNRALYRPQVERIARRHGLDPKLLDAVIVVESGYDPDAVSRKGAMGLMQLMPGTAKRFDVADPFDPVANMNGGARYLSWLMAHFENDLELSLAAYNAGETALSRSGGTIPPYEETRTFVDRVLRIYQTARKER